MTISQSRGQHYIYVKVELRVKNDNIWKFECEVEKLVLVKWDTWSTHWPNLDVKESCSNQQEEKDRTKSHVES